MNFFTYIKNLLQLILSPKHAWMDINADDDTMDTITRRGMYPLMAVMLVSVFIRPLYRSGTYSVEALLQTALVQFVALFVAFFAGRLAMDTMLPKYNSTHSPDIIATGTVAAYITGIMTLIQILENLLPVELTVTQLLPLLAAVILWKAAPYLDIEENSEAVFMVPATLALIGPVILINIVMTALIN